MLKKFTIKASLLTLGLLSALALFGMPASASADINSIAGTSSAQGYWHTPKYVALGDSVAAGLGVDPAITDTLSDIACGRSEGAYNSYVSARINEVLDTVNLHMDSKLIACQGAKTDHFTQNQTVGSVTLEPQLEKAFAGGKPALVTITMGANDIQWSQFIAQCFSEAACNTPANTAAAQALIGGAKSKLVSSLSEVKQRSGFVPPLVVVTGYYNPVSTLCVSGDLTADEVAWIGEQTQALNNALRSATEQPGTGWFTEFAEVDFTGHDICSADSWIQRPGVPGEPAPFHPTARGQEAIGQAVLKQIGL